MVEANLQLDWDGDSMILLDEAGDVATFPLESGKKYTMTLDVKSTRGTGMSPSRAKTVKHVGHNRCHHCKSGRQSRGILHVHSIWKDVDCPVGAF